MTKQQHNLESLCYNLGLSHVASNFKHVFGENIDVRMKFQTLLEEEYNQKEKERVRKRLRIAKFPRLLYLSDLVREDLPKGMQNVLPDLETMNFITEPRNIILYGNPGTGKTHIATGLGIEACKLGMSVLFTSTPHLITKLRESKSAKELHLFESRFEKYDLVICDEFGYMAYDKEAGELLFNLISLRAEKKSTIITTNLPFNRWGEVIKDKVLVTAFIDRISHGAYLINMQGKSYRLKETEAFNNSLRQKNGEDGSKASEGE